MKGTKNILQEEWQTFFLLLPTVVNFGNLCFQYWFNAKKKKKTDNFARMFFKNIISILVLYHSEREAMITLSSRIFQFLKYMKKSECC